VSRLIYLQFSGWSFYTINLSCFFFLFVVIQVRIQYWRSFTACYSSNLSCEGTLFILWFLL